MYQQVFKVGLGALLSLNLGFRELNLSFTGLMTGVMNQVQSQEEYGIVDLCGASSGGINGGGLSQVMTLLGLMLGLFYFMIARPESRRKQALIEQRQALQVGDEVIVAGIYGRVKHLDTSRVVISTLDGSTFEVMRDALFPVEKES